MTIDGTTAFGLGTADMKSGCAAMIEAFTSHYERRGGIAGAALSLVVGEEETGDGAAALVDEVHPAWSVVAEPTDMVPALAHYGYIEIELDTSGERSHASMAKTNDSAVKTMLNLLLKMSQHLDAAHPELICNIRDVHSSEGGFAVPDSCSASIDLHVPPKANLGKLVSEIEELNQSMNGRKAELSFETVHNGYDLPMQGLLPEIITKVYKEQGLPLKTAPFRSHSDASILWASGIRPIILGPGQLSKAHTYHESVEIPQVEQAAHIYYRILHELENVKE
uniref:Peptidase M20 n=1 Tax=uncultured bacterium pFosLip TaxID=380391 RepID=Q1PAF3_9BACT|nr:peptidase M20 [uncultured bacterium pFosLip]